MSLMDQYKKKLVTAEQAARVVKSGDWVEYGSFLGMGRACDKALAARKGELKDVKVRSCVTAYAPEVVLADPKADNLVVRRQGKGTFVATHTEGAHSTFRFLHIRRDDGVDEYPASRIVDVKRGKADDDVARLLGLAPGDGVVVVRRLLDWDGAPAVLDEITLPAALFRGLTRAKLEAYEGSMYGFFETAFGVRVIAAHERLKAVAAPAEAATLLGVAPGTPLLEVDLVAFTYGGRPVEFRRGLCSTARHHYFNALG